MWEDYNKSLFFSFAKIQFNKNEKKMYHISLSLFFLLILKLQGTLTSRNKKTFFFASKG